MLVDCLAVGSRTWKACELCFRMLTAVVHCPSFFVLVLTHDAYLADSPTATRTARSIYHALRSDFFAVLLMLPVGPIISS